MINYPFSTTIIYVILSVHSTLSVQCCSSYTQTWKLLYQFHTVISNSTGTGGN